MRLVATAEMCDNTSLDAACRLRNRFTLDMLQAALSYAWLGAHELGLALDLGSTPALRLTTVK